MRSVATIGPLALAAGALLAGCAPQRETGAAADSNATLAAIPAESGRGDAHDVEPAGEHRDGGHDEEGEEPGTELAKHERYDAVRRGARLVMTYDSQDNVFRGAVVNTTTRTLERVRVEVHLSNGLELGPTAPVDLAPGATHDVLLPATSASFETWRAHAEVGRGEHGHGGCL